MNRIKTQVLSMVENPTAYKKAYMRIIDGFRKNCWFCPLWGGENPHKRFSRSWKRHRRNQWKLPD